MQTNWSDIRKHIQERISKPTGPTSLVRTVYMSVLMTVHDYGKQCSPEQFK